MRRKEKKDDSTFYVKTWCDTAGSLFAMHIVLKRSQSVAAVHFRWKGSTDEFIFNLVVLADMDHRHIKSIQSVPLFPPFLLSSYIDNKLPLPPVEKKPSLKYTDHLLMLHLAFQESRPSWNSSTKRMDLCLHYCLAEWCLLLEMLPLVG